ncbi:hypothetical protein WG902_19625 [Ramlibacter sp. PS3R-8]|uniref:hypothetical protein n=1 Tax=Ramlibacter sp. PS3R-8 TaxID=3133437 RepID=UPI0030AE4DED
MNLRSVVFLALTFLFLGFAVATWLDRIPIKALRNPQDPDLPFYMRQPSWWAIASAALGVACLHAALYSRFSMLVMLALAAGVWLGLVARMMLAKAVSEGREAAPMPWWRGDLGIALAGGAGIAVAVALMAKSGGHEVAAFVAVVLAICGLVAVGRWMGAVVGMVVAGER